MDNNTKKRFEELLLQFDCDYNLLYADIREVKRQKDIVNDKVIFYDVSTKEAKEEILKLKEVIKDAKNKMEERWRNLESITSAMSKLLNNN